mgnify:CR=1 FL=1
MWQVCPICNGTGIVPQDGFTSACYQTCTVCNGHKIISELTGLPPTIVSGFHKMIDPELKNLKDPE